MPGLLSHPAGKLILGLVIGVNGLGVLAGLQLLAQPPETPQRPNGTMSLQQVEERAERLRIQFDYWEKRATQTQVLVGIILAVNSVYSLALAAATYLNLKPTLESARRDLDDLRRFMESSRKDLTEFRSEIRADLPTLQNMDKALRLILSDLRRRLPTDKNWRSPAYFPSLTSQEREQIRYAELTVAGFKFFELGKISAFRTVVSEIYRGLGHFYGSHFASVAAGPAPLDPSLFARAFLYFDEASDIHPENAGVFKDIGVLHTVASEDPLRLRLARAAFERSLQIDPHEPGALFGLGWLEYRGQRWEEAARVYASLIEKKYWKDADRKKYLPDAYLNRACCLARRSLPALTGQNAGLLLKDCADGLRIAAEVNEGKEFLGRLAAELADDGDLRDLARACPDEVQRLLS